MKGQGRYVPPIYVPLNQSDTDVDADSATEADSGSVDDGHSSNRPVSQDPAQWSSGICACFDDMQSCTLLSDPLNARSYSAGTLLALPGATVACYACGYRRALRAKYNLQEAPCGDLTTHLFCHLCALCQEYREIRERTDRSAPAVALPEVTAPPLQTMVFSPKK